VRKFTPKEFYNNASWVLQQFGPRMNFVSFWPIKRIHILFSSRGTNRRAKLECLSPTSLSSNYACLRVIPECAVKWEDPLGGPLALPANIKCPSAKRLLQHITLVKGLMVYVKPSDLH
jgi:hypothetical protein